MASVYDVLDTDPTSVHAALAASVDVLSGQQSVQFVPYVRTVLPVDGFVFWVNANLLTAPQLAAAGLAAPLTVTIPGSLHYASIGTQTSDETIVVRHVDFTAEQQITAFAEIAPTVMYVGTWTTPLGSFRFTFSRRNTYYRTADIHHYVGDAVYPAFETQLVDTITQFSMRQVVSNSLPLWLAMVRTVPYPMLVTSAVPLYPAFLTYPNLEPPYGSVEIPPRSTRPIQAQAWRGSDSSRWQLVSERARLTLYGLRNDEAMDFVDYLVDYAAVTGAFGLMTTPVVADEHRAQVELAVLAVKKVVEVDICYYQQRARDTARQLIKQAIPGIALSDDPILPPIPPLLPPS